MAGGRLFGRLATVDGIGDEVLMPFSDARILPASSTLIIGSEVLGTLLAELPAVVVTTMDVAAVEVLGAAVVTVIVVVVVASQLL